MAKDCDNRASEIDLAGVWTLSGTGEDGASALSLPASVPGDVQSALFAVGLLAVPREVMENMTNYTDNAEVLYRWRDEMADLIELAE